MILEREDGTAVVRLDAMEMRLAGLVAVERRTESICSGRNKNVHAEKSDLGTDFEGCAAEMAVAKYLGVYWYPGVNTFKAPDVGACIQVRSTPYRSGHLIIRDNDTVPQHRTVLVITQPPYFKLVGWAFVGEVRRGERRPADDRGVAGWWFPQDRLRPMRSLMESAVDGEDEFRWPLTA